MSLLLLFGGPLDIPAAPPPPPASTLATALTTTGTVGNGLTVRGAVMEFIVVNGTTAGTLAARVKADAGGGTLTIKAGSHCSVTQMPAGS